MTKDRVVFFANGDFAIDTFKTLVNNGSNIVGLVTSAKDKVRFHSKTIREVAEELRVPYYLIKGDNFEEDTFFIDWLKRMKADIFCVISFKKMPKNIIKLAKKCAFNVHASLLPLLRGAAPINWAIRLGYKETGLTAFVLSDQIDCGDIIANHKVKIATGEKYTTLFKKLSDDCVDFTNHVIEDILQKDDWKTHLIKQPSWNEEYEYIHKATKVDSNYFRSHWSHFNDRDFINLVNSVDNVGLPCVIITRDANGKYKKIDAKIYEVEGVNADEMPFSFTESDGKSFITLNFGDGSAVEIKVIQIVGKKIMDTPTFLNGFRYFRDKDYTTLITDLMEADLYEQDSEV